MEIPVIDWELSIKMAGNNSHYAKEFLTLLAADLKSELIKIKQAYELKNYKEIKIRLHKLHGALSYCGVPRLKAATLAFEEAFKKKMDIFPLLAQFEFEVHQLLDQM